MSNKEKLAKISFCTPCYNDGNMIEKMVDSVLTQDWPNIEQIVVDDGSTDGSRKVLKKLEKKYKNLKVIYLKKNGGACAARNLAAKHATGKYLSFLPADAVLYPGMARIWVTKLEENPQFDFLYGGYRFINEEGQPVNDYVGDSFDPYFLEVANYIDGSFPLKKELFDKMGGWDLAIKSLQDWDFWLNAVKRHKAEGLYIADIFFETTLPHPGGLSYDSHENWLARTNQIKDKYGIKDRKICVTGTGARFHAKNIAKMLDADYKDMPSFKPHKYEMIYIVGFFGKVMEALIGTDALRVLHWIGSDVSSLLADPDKRRQQYIVNWINNNIDVNFAEFEPTRKELESIGIKARVLPLPPRKFYYPTPLPKKFTVAVYDPYQNKEHYFPDLIKDVAKETKDIEWKFFGDHTLMGKKGNIEHCGVVNDMDTLIKDSSCLLRVSRHDGLPLSVIEFASAERNIITNVPSLKHVINVKAEKKSILEALKKAKKLSANKAGAKYYRDLGDHQKFINAIKDLMVYDPKKYWQDRADSWDKIEGLTRDSKEEYIIIKELDELKPKSILDIGCGNGKWAKILAEGNREYLGIDISKSLIQKAKKNFPNLSFIEADIREIDKKVNERVDVIFSYTSLLHIPPEQIKEVIEKLKKVGNYLVLVEPTVEIDVRGVQMRNIHPEIIKAQQEGKVIYGVKSSFVHNYTSLLDVKKIVNLYPRSLIVAKL